MKKRTPEDIGRAAAADVIALMGRRLLEQESAAEVSAADGITDTFARLIDETVRSNNETRASRLKKIELYLDSMHTAIEAVKKANPDPLKASAPLRKKKVDESARDACIRRLLPPGVVAKRRAEHLLEGKGGRR